MKLLIFRAGNRRIQPGSKAGEIMESYLGDDDFMNGNVNDEYNDYSAIDLLNLLSESFQDVLFSCEVFDESERVYDIHYMKNGKIKTYSQQDLVNETYMKETTNG